VKNLSGMDDIHALKYATDQLNSDSKNDLFQDDQDVKSLLAVEKNTQLIADRISTLYMSTEHINAELEKQIENAMYLYYRQKFIIYNGLVNKFCQSNHALLPVLLALSMSCAIRMIKWRYYNYEAAPANVWLQLSNLYKIAEQKVLLNSSVQVYANQEPIKLSAAYIQACMLGTLESLSLNRKQLEMACKILETLNANILIENVYDEKKHLFYVDVAINAPAKRIRNFTPTDTCRYWCLDELNFNVELGIALIESNAAHKHLVMKDFIHSKYALETLEVLHAEWSRLDYKRQRRSEDRHKILKSATTAYGFEDTCYQLKQYENLQAQTLVASQGVGVSIDLVKNSTAPNVIYMDLGAGYSNIVDESKRGLGLHVKKHAGEVNLDMMVCVSVGDESSECKIGLIRSIKPISADELHLMVEVLSDSAVCVEAKNMSLKTTDLRENESKPNLNMDVHIPFTGIFLPKETGLTDQETLVLPRFQYNSSDVFKVHIMGEDKLLKLTDIIDQQDDWVRVTYNQH